MVIIKNEFKFRLIVLMSILDVEIYVNLNDFILLFIILEQKEKVNVLDGINFIYVYQKIT